MLLVIAPPLLFNIIAMDNEYYKRKNTHTSLKEWFNSRSWFIVLEFIIFGAGLVTGALLCVVLK